MQEPSIGMSHLQGSNERNMDQGWGSQPCVEWKMKTPGRWLLITHMPQHTQTHARTHARTHAHRLPFTLPQNNKYHPTSICNGNRDMHARTHTHTLLSDVLSESIACGGRHRGVGPRRSRTQMYKVRPARALGIKEGVTLWDCGGRRVLKVEVNS
jgi:hypothetical protein